MSKSKASEYEDDKARFTPPARRPLSIARRGDPRYITLTHDEGGHCRGYVLKDPEAYELIGQLAADGASMALIAQQLGIDAGTFGDIRRRDPLAQEMVDRGRAVLTSEVIDTTVQHMREGSLTAAIWLGKVRCGMQEQSGEVEGATPKQVTNNTQINIHMPPKMTDEQFAELMKLTAPSIEAPSPPPKLKVDR